MVWSLSQFYLQFTPSRTHSISKWTRISALEITIFGLKMMVKSGLDFFFILKALSEIPANLPGQFSLSGQIFFALGSSNSEGACGI